MGTETKNFFAFGRNFSYKIPKLGLRISDPSDRRSVHPLISLIVDH